MNLSNPRRWLTALAALSLAVGLAILMEPSFGAVLEDTPQQSAAEGDSMLHIRLVDRVDGAVVPPVDFPGAELRFVHGVLAWVREIRLGVPSNIGSNELVIAGDEVILGPNPIDDVYAFIGARYHQALRESWRESASGLERVLAQYYRGRGLDYARLSSAPASLNSAPDSNSSAFALRPLVTERGRPYVAFSQRQIGLREWEVQRIDGQRELLTAPAHFSQPALKWDARHGFAWTGYVRA